VPKSGRFRIRGKLATGCGLQPFEDVGDGTSILLKAGPGYVDPRLQEPLASVRKPFEYHSSETHQKQESDNLPLRMPSKIIDHSSIAGHGFQTPNAASMASPKLVQESLPPLPGRVGWGLGSGGFKRLSGALSAPGYYRAGPPGQLLRAPAPFGQVDSAFRLAVLGAPEAHCLAPAGSPGQLERGR